MGRPNVREFRSFWSSCDRCGYGASFQEHLFGYGKKRSPDLCFLRTAPTVIDTMQERFLSSPQLREYLENVTAEVGKVVGKKLNFFATPLLLCRPRSGSRPPSSEEFTTCALRIQQQFSFLRPRIVVPVGEAAELFSSWLVGRLPIVSFPERDDWRSREEWEDGIRRVAEGYLDAKS